MTPPRHDLDDPIDDGGDDPIDEWADTGEEDDEDERARA